jgi:hypothetical protein
MKPIQVLIDERLLSGRYRFTAPDRLRPVVIPPVARGHGAAVALSGGAGPLSGLPSPADPR